MDKLFIFKDELFCWVCVVVAETEEEARAYAETSGAELVEIRDFSPGFVCEGGGNG